MRGFVFYCFYWYATNSTFGRDFIKLYTFPKMAYFSKWHIFQNDIFQYHFTQKRSHRNWANGIVLSWWTLMCRLMTFSLGLLLKLHALPRWFSGRFRRKELSPVWFELWWYRRRPPRVRLEHFGVRSAISRFAIDRICCWSCSSIVSDFITWWPLSGPCASSGLNRLHSRLPR